MPKFCVKEHFASVKKIIEKKVSDETCTSNEVSILNAIKVADSKPEYYSILFRMLYNKVCPLYFLTSYLEELHIESN